jgi:hypothetical protein
VELRHEGTTGQHSLSARRAGGSNRPHRAERRQPQPCQRCLSNRHSAKRPLHSRCGLPASGKSRRSLAQPGVPAGSRHCCCLSGQLPPTEGSLAVTESAAPSAGDWAPCRCCGRSYLTTTMVRFQRDPDEALCIGCVSWLHECSRPIARRLYPSWQLPACVRRWITLHRATRVDGDRKVRQE